jgi:hypothetical protein
MRSNQRARLKRSSQGHCPASSEAECVTEQYTALVFSSEPATIRKLVVWGENLAADDPSCYVCEPLSGSLSCAEGVKIRASLGGYRLSSFYDAPI